MIDKNKELNLKQKIFCEEYIIDFNGRQAAIRAGYEESCAAQTASEILTYPNVQDYIKLLLDKRIERTQVTQDRVLIEIARLAFNDPRKAFDENSNLLSVQKWPDEVAACVSSIKVVEEKKDRDDETPSVTFVKEIKFWDKGKQLELLGRHLAMFTDKLNVGGQKDNPVTVLEAPKLSKDEWLKAHGLGQIIEQ